MKTWTLKELLQIETIIIIYFDILCLIYLRKTIKNLFELWEVIEVPDFST